MATTRGALVMADRSAPISRRGRCARPRASRPRPLIGLNGQLRGRSPGKGGRPLASSPAKPRSASARRTVDAPVRVRIASTSSGSNSRRRRLPSQAWKRSVGARDGHTPRPSPPALGVRTPRRARETPRTRRARTGPRCPPRGASRAAGVGPRSRARRRGRAALLMRGRVAGHHKAQACGRARCCQRAAAGAAGCVDVSPTATARRGRSSRTRAGRAVRPKGVDRAGRRHRHPQRSYVDLSPPHPRCLIRSSRVVAASTITRCDRCAAMARAPASPAPGVRSAVRDDVVEVVDCRDAGEPRVGGGGTGQLNARRRSRPCRQPRKQCLLAAAPIRTVAGHGLGRRYVPPRKSSPAASRFTKAVKRSSTAAVRRPGSARGRNLHPTRLARHKEDEVEGHVFRDVQARRAHTRAQVPRAASSQVDGRPEPLQLRRRTRPAERCIDRGRGGRGVVRIEVAQRRRRRPRAGPGCRSRPPGRLVHRLEHRQGRIPRRASGTRRSRPAATAPRARRRPRSPGNRTRSRRRTPAQWPRSCSS